MAEISKSRFSIYQQPSPGNNGTSAQWQNVNVTLPGVSGGPANTEVESQRIDPDRQAPGVKIVGGGSGLSIPFEAQVPTAATQAFWLMLKASIYAGAASATYASTANATWNNADDVLTINASDQASLFSSSVTAGDIIQIWSNAAPSVKYYARITGRNDSGSNTLSLTLDINNENASITDARFKKGTTITNSNTQATFGMLRSFYSPGAVDYDRFELFSQEVIESAQVSVNSQSLITGTFSTVGVGSEAITDDIADYGIGTPTYAAGPSSDVLDGTNNIPFLRVAAADYPLQAFTVGWQNNSQTRRVIGSYAATGISAGIFRGSGQMSAYFDDFAEFNKAIAGSPSSAYVVCEDSSQRALIISMPQIRYGNPTLPGQDRDVIAQLPFQFEKDDVEGISVRISFIN